MRVLVTGATGFVGQHLCGRLAQSGFEVVATGRDPDKATKGLSFYAQDLNSPIELPECQAVVHLAGLSSPWNSRENFFRGNKEATDNLLCWSKAVGVEHVLYLSTSGVYFANTSGEMVTEQDSLPQPEHQHPYVSSKRQAENLVSKSQIPWTTLRPRAIYGPGDTSLLPRIVNRLKSGRLPVLGKGNNRSSLTHVENVSLAIQHFLERGPSGIVNITDGAPVEIWPTIADIARQLGTPPPSRKIPSGLAYRFAALSELAHKRFPQLGEPVLTRYTVGLLSLDQTLSIEKAESLGYRPAFDTQEGIRRTLKDFRT